MNNSIKILIRNEKIIIILIEIEKCLTIQINSYLLNKRLLNIELCETSQKKDNQIIGNSFN
jgi:hypothetical protein